MKVYTTSRTILYLPKQHRHRHYIVIFQSYNKTGIALAQSTTARSPTVNMKHRTEMSYREGHLSSKKAHKSSIKITPKYDKSIITDVTLEGAWHNRMEAKQEVCHFIAQDTNKEMKKYFCQPSHPLIMKPLY